MKRLLLLLSAVACLSVAACQKPAKQVVADCKPDPAVAEAIARVSPDSIRTWIEELVAFHTRHSLSTQTDPERGIGAAVHYLVNRCEAWGRKAEGVRPTMLTATLFALVGAAIAIGATFIRKKEISDQ